MPLAQYKTAAQLKTVALLLNSPVELIMRVDIKIVVLSLISICLILEAEAWFGRRRGGRSSRSRSSSSRIRRSGGGWLGGRRSSSRRTSSTRRRGWFGGRRSNSRSTPSRKSGGWSLGSSGKSSSSSSSKKTIPHDIKTKKGLTKLFNKKVVSFQPVEKPFLENLGKKSVALANKAGIKTSISGEKNRFMHSGVVVTTEDGKKYLVHKGKGFGRKGSSQTVVLDAEHMSNVWENVGKNTNTKGKIVGDFVKAGGKDYNVWGKNCHDATEKMKRLGKRKKRSLHSVEAWNKGTENWK